MACILLVITALNSVDFEDSEKQKVSLEQFLMRFFDIEMSFARSVLGSRYCCLVLSYLLLGIVLLVA